MKKENIPKDDWGLSDNVSQELCYATDADGSYTTGLSPGWEAKNIALSQAWHDIKDALVQTVNEVEEGSVSPLKFYMQFNLMEPFLLASFVGIATWRVKLHMKPMFYNKMGDKMLSKYATELGISVDDMKNPNHVPSINVEEAVKQKSGVEV